MLLLVILISGIAVLVGLAAVLDVRSRRRGHRTIEGGWRAIRDTRRDLRAARYTSYLGKDYKWTGRNRRGDGV